MLLGRAVLLAAAWAALAGAAEAQLAPIPQDRGGNGLGLALRRIGVTPRVLWVTAHPDDENNAMLVRLSRGQGVRTALLTLTRGDGGQNAIGPELFDALAVLRSEELAAIHRYDGVEQYFGLSSDFGFSFSVEENLDRWGRDPALEDVVRVVRAFRPDVIVTLPLEGPGGGQAHHAAARLARDAFTAAGDPARFPAAGAPWQARRIYQGGIGGGGSSARAGAVTVKTDVYDPLLGATWLQFGRAARTLHRSQAMSQVPASTGGGDSLFVLIGGEPLAASGEADILHGLDLTFAGLLRLVPDPASAAPFLGPRLAQLQERLEAARASYDAAAPEKALPPLRRLLVETRALAAQVRASAVPQGPRAELVARLEDEEADIETAITRAHGVEVESIASDDLVVPGQDLVVTTTIVNNGAAPIQVEGASLALTPGWSLAQLEGTRPELGPGERTVYVHRVWVPQGAAPSRPDWTRTRGADRFQAASAALAARAWAPADVRAMVRYHSGGAAAPEGPVVVRAENPSHRRYPWPDGGEKQRTVTVVPPLSVRVEPETTVVRAGAPSPREIRVAVRSRGREASTARVRLEAPRGWTVAPAEVSLAFRHEDEEKAARFTVTPAAGASADATVRAVAVDAAGKEHASGEQVVAYEHVHERRLIRPAEARVLSLDVAVPAGVSVGYVDGAGDEVDSAVRQLGVPLTYLGPDDLAFGDLSRFTTIVTGIRAYETRPDLRSYHDRLMRYVEEGGNLVVQYNRTAFNRAGDAPPAPAPAGTVVDSPFAPYPASVSDARVTDEGAAPEVLRAGHPLLAAPNRIGPADWSGWVQERGLNFLDARDPRYVDIVAFTDPFPLNPGRKTGALVDTAVGKGRWTYVGLGLFRQVPAGVPGGWRLLANLVSRPRGM